MQTITLLLDAPLQSWGGEARNFLYRGTEDRPTFSAVVGLLCSCLGMSFRREYDKVRVLRDNIKIDVISITKPSVLVDYQTCGGGIDTSSKSLFDKMRIPKKDKGKSEMKVYKKEYLQDAKFIVNVNIDDRLDIERIRKAVKEPKWIPFLGRFCCTPAMPLLVENPSVLKAIWLGKGFSKVKIFRHVELNVAEYLVRDYPSCDGLNGYTVRGISEEDATIDILDSIIKV